MNFLNIIKCPTCGREYLPTEIYIPSAFFGEPDIVKRDTEGTIIGCVGKGPDLEESYICDFCNKPFKVRATLNFETQVYDEVDFSSEFTSRNDVKYTLDEF